MLLTAFDHNGPPRRGGSGDREIFESRLPEDGFRFLYSSLRLRQSSEFLPEKNCIRRR